MGRVNAIIEFSINYHICFKKRMFEVISSIEFPYFNVHGLLVILVAIGVSLKKRINDKVLASKIVIIKHPFNV